MDNEQGEQMEVGEVQAGEPEIVFIDEKRGKFSDAGKLQVEHMIDLLKLGSTVQEAASKTGTDIEALSHDSKAMKHLAENLKEYSLSNAQLKQLVRSESVKIAIEGGDEKDKLAALKLIAAFPGVDLAGASKTQVQVGVGIFSEETTAVLDSLD